MKKIYLLFIFTIFSLLLVSCNNNEKQTSTEQVESKTQETIIEPVITTKEKTIEDPFKEEREKAIAELDEYFDSLDKSLFNSFYLNQAKEIIDRGKENILNAETKTRISICVINTKGEMNVLKNKIIAVNPSTNPPTENLFANARKFTSGSGTEEDPYIIDTPEELLYLSKEAYEGNSEGIYYELGADINLNEIGRWDFPIGISNAFKGHFDGRGHIIQNLKIENTDSDFNRRLWYTGLFGINKGEIKNVGLVNFEIVVDTSDTFGRDSSQDIGSICGYNEGIINNCYMIGSMDIKYDGSSWDQEKAPDDIHVGKICCINEKNGVINNCFAFVDIVVEIHSDFDNNYSLISLGNGKCYNCLSVGQLHELGDCDDKTILRSTDNNYVYVSQYQFGYGPIKRYDRNNCNEEDLNNKCFYIDILGWDEEIWNLDDIIFQDNVYLADHYPKLKVIGDE